MSSILQYPEDTNNNTQLHVWNNAAFDREEEQGSFSYFPMNTSWSSSDCTKENLSPAALNSSPNPVLRNSNTKFTKKNSNKGFGFDEKKIDEEIEEIEKEIKRLQSRLEALRLEKAERIAVEKRGRVVAAKFMEQPKPKQKAVDFKKVEETPKAKVVNFRRGMSLGPAEIVARAPPGKADVTPLPATTQNRRKSCFWKLQDVDEDEGKRKGFSERRKTLFQSAGQSARKCVKKKEEWVEPRKLFKEGEKSVSVSNKKGLKQGRVVASRYNQSGDARKRSLPENNQGSEVVRMKKRWEIPAEVVVGCNKSEEVSGGVVLLPKIRTLRCGNNESPRDSGAAKRVAELTGKRSYFCPDEDVEGSICQVLSFAEEEG